MTDQPPPLRGNYPPPQSGYRPSPQSGYQPSQAGVGYPPLPAAPGPALPTEAYTPWLTRVLAWIVDSVPLFILGAIGSAIYIWDAQGTACVTDTSEYELGEFCASGWVGPSALGMTVAFITWLAGLAYVVWNYGCRQGTTGSSIGKSVMKFKVVSEKTWQPIGFGLSIVRQLAHIVDQIICYIGYLFPLWDPKRQTMADKIMTTVCVPLSPQELNPQPLPPLPPSQ